MIDDFENEITAEMSTIKKRIHSENNADSLMEDEQRDIDSIKNILKVPVAENIARNEGKT